MYYIYKITNLVNGKTYIGQHKYKKLNDSYMGSGIHIKRAIKKYGVKNFKKEILYSNIQYKETVDDMERFAIAKERAIGKAEYNIADGGAGVSMPCSPEHKRKLSEAHKEKHHSEEWKRNMSEAMKGKPQPWNKGRISWNKGKHHSEKSKKKMSESHKGHVAWNKGKHFGPLSEETKKKISEVLKGKCHSEETKEKIREAAQNRKPISEETRKKKSEAIKGKHWKLVDGKRVWY